MKNQSEGVDNRGFQSSELPRDATSVVSLKYRIEPDPSSDCDNDKEREWVQDESEGTNPEGCDFETAIMQTGFGKYNILMMCASFPGFLGALIATSSTALILPSAECDLDLTNVEMGLMNSVSYIGMVTFAFLWGFLSDLFGRRKILIIAFLMDVALTVCFSLAQSFKFFITAKLFSGFVSAAPYALLMTYIAEFHSSKYRASTMVWTGTIGALCNICLPGVAWLIIPLPIQATLAGGMISLPSWRIFLLVCGVPSLLAAATLALFAESPKFLMSAGRNDEAMKVFRTMYRINTGKPEDTFPVKSLANEKREPKKSSQNKKTFFGEGLSQIKPLFRKPYLSKVLLVFAVHACNFAGLNTVRLWVPQLFSLMLDKEMSQSSDYSPSTVCDLLSRSFDNETNIPEFVPCSEHFVQPRVYINSMIVGAINGIGFFISGYIVAIIGKKILIIFAFTFATLTAAGMYWSTTSNIMMGVVAGFLTLGSITSTTLISVIVDLIPTSQRSMAVSLTLMFGRCGSMIGNMIFAMLIEANCAILFIIISLICLGCAGLSLLLPRTKGAALK